MKIAIIGGAGFIGTHLTKAYRDAGHDVFIIDTLSYGATQSIPANTRFYQVDMRDSKLATILRNERPDVVSLHATQCRDAIITEQTLTDADLHVRGLLNVLDSCVNASVKKIIFASNGNSLYGSIQDELHLVKEDMSLQPRSSHDISKAAGEWYVRFYSQQYRLKHTILRYADVYGETEALPLHHPLSYFIQSILDQQRPVIRGTGNEKLDHIFIDDVITANLQALKYGDNCTLHISSGQSHSLNHLCELVSAIMDSTLAPMHLSATFGETHSIALDNTSARHMLFWQPQITLMEGIRQAIQRIINYRTHQPALPTTENALPTVAIVAEHSLTHA